MLSSGLHRHPHVCAYMHTQSHMHIKYTHTYIHTNKKINKIFIFTKIKNYNVYSVVELHAKIAKAYRRTLQALGGVVNYSKLSTNMATVSLLTPSPLST